MKEKGTTLMTMLYKELISWS